MFSSLWYYLVSFNIAIPTKRAYIALFTYMQILKATLTGNEQSVAWSLIQMSGWESQIAWLCYKQKFHARH